MRLRSHEVRARDDVGTPSFGVSVNINSQSLPQPAPASVSAAQQPWDPTVSAGSTRVDLGPPRTDFYTECDIKYTNEGWSYEVVTYNEIFRISTIPADFFGNTDKWPSTLETSHQAYKDTERPLDRARYDCIIAMNAESEDHAEIYDLLKTKYEYLMPAVRARAQFMKEWPSAFNYNENTKGHKYWAEALLNEAQSCQRFGWFHYRLAELNKDSSVLSWLNEHLDHYAIIGPRTYAMSPNQYIHLRQRVQAKKIHKREEVEGMRPDDWAARASPDATLFRPNLPSLKTEIAMPQSSNPADVSMPTSSDADDYFYSLCENPLSSLPESLFRFLCSDKCSV